MYKNVIDPGKSVSFVMKDIDIGGQNQHAMCTGSCILINIYNIIICSILHYLNVLYYLVV